MGSGQAPVKKYNEYLRDLIVNGRAKPSKIVSHRINIEDAPDAYSKFDKRIEGYTKVLIRFGEKVAA
jgi:glutathione-independent formaldehyde dehydrogenase